MTEVFIKLILGLIFIFIGKKLLQKSEKATRHTIKNTLFIVGMLILWTGILCCFIVWLTLETR